jgi:peroxiredoxin
MACPFVLNGPIIENLFFSLENEIVILQPHLKQSIVNKILYCCLLLLTWTACKRRQPVYMYTDETGKPVTRDEMMKRLDKDSVAKYKIYGVDAINTIYNGDTVTTIYRLYYGEKPFTKRNKGRSLPAFALHDLDGHLLKSEELKGRIVHINFWSPNCYPCVLETDELNSLHAKHKDSVVFLAIAGEGQKTLHRFLNKHPFHYRILHSGRAYMHSIGDWGVPKNFFIDRKGVIREVVEGTRYNPATKKIMVMQYYDSIIQQLLRE